MAAKVVFGSETGHSLFLGRIARFAGKYIIFPLLFRILQTSKFRIVLIHNSDRFGHLAKNTHLFFIKKKLGTLDNFNYLLISPSIKSKKIANVSLLNMFISHSKQVKNVRFICSNFLHNLFSLYFQDKSNNSELLFDISMTSTESEFSFGMKTIDFSDIEKKYGENALKEMSIPPNKKIVTVFARDPSYLKSKNPKTDWSYHSYRDADIETYVDSIKYLISMDYVVIRVGSEYSKKLNFKDENYFEYSLSAFKSDFMDLYLIYKSTFVLGNSSGALDLANVFNIPWAAVNYAPFMVGPLGKEDIFIQKTIINSDGTIIPFKDIINDKRYYLHNGVKLRDDFGLSYVDNSPGDILDITIEMHNILNGNLVLNAKQKNLLNRYHSEYCQKNNWSNKYAPISITWLENHHHLYLDDI